MATETTQARGAIFHGWWIVLVAAIGLSVGYGPIVTFTFGVFFKPLSQEFGWNRAQVSLAFSLSLLVMSVVLPFVGRAVDRLGARKVIVPSVVLFGLGFMSFALLSPRLWLLYAIYIALGVVGGGTAPVPYSNVLSHWFDKRRGLALGVAMVGLGLGTFLMPSLAQRLIEVGGWRWAYVCIGLMVILVAAPVVALFLKETPHMFGLASDGEPADSTAVYEKQKTGLSFHDARGTSTFWMMVSTFFLMSVAVHGCLIHLVPLLTDRGVSPQGAALATSLLGGALLLGRVGAGYLLDRFAASVVAAGFFGGATLGLVLLWSGAAGEMAFLASFLVGLGMGAEGDIIAYLVSRYFGLRAFGEIYGYAFAAFTLGGVVGPLLMGVGFEATGSYRFVLGVFVGACLVAAGLMTQLGPYRLWEGTPTAQVAASS